MVRSKVGGRAAGSLSSYMGGTLGTSLYDTHVKQGNVQDRWAPKKETAKEVERDVSVLPTPLPPRLFIIVSISSSNPRES